MYQMELGKTSFGAVFLLVEVGPVQSTAGWVRVSLAGEDGEEGMPGRSCVMGEAGETGRSGK